MSTVFSIFIFFCMIPHLTRSTPLSLHDALPILKLALVGGKLLQSTHAPAGANDRYQITGLHLLVNEFFQRTANVVGDRKSTRLNSSHQIISYAVFCLKKKKQSLDSLLH